jgi:hypothetical protein
MPEMARRVVVFPAPFAPRSATTTRSLELAAAFLVPSGRGGGLPEADQGALGVLEVGGEAHYPDSLAFGDGRADALAQPEF